MTSERVLEDSRHRFSLNADPSQICLSKVRNTPKWSIPNVQTTLASPGDLGSFSGSWKSYNLLLFQRFDQVTNESERAEE
jgi:hypothetical protein